MSIINSDQFNTDWQLRVLKGLQALNDLAVNDQSSATLIALLQPKVRKIKIISVEDDSGDTSEDLCSVSIANVGSAPGTVNSVALPVGVTLNFDAGALNNTLGTISYDATGTTFLITEMK